MHLVSVVSRVVRRFGSFLKTDEPTRPFTISYPSNFRQESHISPQAFGKVEDNKFFPIQEKCEESEQIQETNSGDELNVVIDETPHYLMLPPELLIHIFTFLFDPTDICSISLTCKQWKLLVNSDVLWKSLYIQNYGPSLANKSFQDGQINWKILFMNQYKIKLPLPYDQEDPLRKASVSGDLAALKKIARRFDLNYPLDNDGYTCLHYASIHGHAEMVRYILQVSSVPVNRRVTEIYRHGAHTRGDTALHMACQHGKIEIVKILVEHGADINILGEDKRTPLHKAAMKGHLNVVMFLVENGAHVGVMDRVGRHTPFDLARTFNQTEVVKYLKSRVPDLEDQ